MTLANRMGRLRGLARRHDAAASERRRARYGTFVASDYDELIDCPVEMGTFVHALL